MCLDNDKKILAFHRWKDGGLNDDVVVVLNFSTNAIEDYTIKFPNDGHWKIRFNSDWEGYDSDFDNYFSYDTEAQSSKHEEEVFANVSIAPYSAIIYSQG